MSYDKRYYGVYEGFVKDIEDPENNNRIRVTVPQVTGDVEWTGWARSCQPVIGNANHPDHQEHTAAQIASLLTTTAVNISGPDSRGDSHTIAVPALTVVAKSGASTLKQPKKTAADTDEFWNDSQETNTTAEHYPQRLLPRLNQTVWIMYISGDPNFPIWIGVQP